MKSERQKMTMLEAITEAKRCLRCKVPLCRKGCPISNDIPDWIHELSMGNLGNAMAIINAKSNLPAVCSRVCAHERQCEGNCVLGKKDRCVSIGRLERFVSDFDNSMGLIRRPIVQKDRGRVAVIGSGPSGLTVAGILARAGFAVDIFEMEPQPGGVLMFGIPEYRLPKDVVTREIDKIRQLGVNIHCNMTAGVDFTIDELLAKGYDAMFIGTGTGKPKELNIPGIHVEGVRRAIYFLRRFSLYRSGFLSREELPVDSTDTVFVVGCGNTAMDAARTARRCGARQVSVIYHRGIENMSALRSEYDEAVSEGVKFLWNTNLLGCYPDETGKVASIRIKDAAGEIIELKATKVLMAIGSAPATRIISTTGGIEVDDGCYVRTGKDPYGMTSKMGVFAGGDVARRTATVVHAMQDAQKVAEGIIKYVDAVRLLARIKEGIGIVHE